MPYLINEREKKKIQASVPPKVVKPFRLPPGAAAPDAVRESREVSESRERKLPRGTKTTTPSERYEEHREKRLVVAGGKGLDPCRRTGKAGGPDRLRACHVELDWLSAEAASSIGSKAGPHLRFCSTLGKKALMVPVSGPKEATRLSREFCKCVGSDKSPGKRTKCATEIGGSKRAPQLGRPYRDPYK